MLSRPFAVPDGTPDEKVRETLRADVERRLRNVCSDWPDEEFQRLVDNVTKTALRYIPRPQV